MSNIVGVTGIAVMAIPVFEGLPASILQRRALYKRMADGIVYIYILMGGKQTDRRTCYETKKAI